MGVIPMKYLVQGILNFSYLLLSEPLFLHVLVKQAHWCFTENSFVS